MTNYEVSGCIVTYNNLSTIRKTLDTLFEQTKDVNFKLYIVDNASTDGTPEMIERDYALHHPIELIRGKANIGFGKGHNSILRRLKSRYHVFINPDVVLTENAIKKMADYMDKHDEIGILSPQIRFPSETEPYGAPQILGRRNPSLKYLIASRMRADGTPGKLLSEYAMLDRGNDAPFEIENATGCFMMIRTDLLKQIGGFDPHYFMYFEDCDITRTVRKTHQAVYFPDAVVCHVWGRESKKNMRLCMIQIKSMFYYFYKWRFDRNHVA